MASSFKLYRLQQVDTQLDQVRQRLQEIEQALNEDEAVKAGQQAVQDAQTGLMSAQKELAFAEEEVKAQQDKLKENQDTLYGGKVTNPKELQDLQAEAEAFGRQLSNLEDAQLEKMSALEAGEEGLAAAQAQLETILAERQIENHTLLDEQAALKEDEARLEHEREPALSGVDEEGLALYDDLRAKKRGLAVAKLTNKSCSACGAELPASLAQAARSPSELVRCPSCKRILYAG